MAFPGDKEVVSPHRPPPTDAHPLSVLAAQRHSGAEDLAKYGENLEAPPGEWWGARHTVALMASLGIGVSYTMRINLSIAIVDMVGVRNDTENPAANVCLPPEGSDPEQEATIGDFSWDEATQGVILGSFFYGYAVAHFPGGRAAEYFGGRLVLALSILGSSILTLLMPLCASLSTELFIAVKILQGLALGGSFPCVNTLLTTWFTPAERSKYTTFIMTGSNIGTVVAMPLSGWLCSLDVLGGWPLAFYSFGILGLVWCVAWFLLVSDRPENHPRISSAELRYLKAGQQYMKEPETVPIHWSAVLTSPYMWVVTVASLGDSYGFYTLLTELPTYLARIQHFDMNKTGFLSALPYLISWLVSIGWGYLVGWLLTSGSLSVVNIRRLSQGVSCYVPALALVMMCFVNCNPVLAMVALCVAVGLNSVNYTGYLSSHQDMAPNLAGSLLGITNTFSSLMGVLSPAITGIMINNNQTLGAWRAVFLTSAVVYVVTCTLFVMFTPDHIQPWNHPQPKTRALERPEDTRGRDEPKL